ncbi:unnamed protein product, partial [Didymodactylos carnosus]
TWIGKKLNVIVSSLGWVDAGPKAQSATSLVPLAIVKIPKEDRLNLDRYVTQDFIRMFERDQTMTLDGCQYQLKFTYSADYKMVNQISNYEFPATVATIVSTAQASTITTVSDDDEEDLSVRRTGSKRRKQIKQPLPSKEVSDIRRGRKNANTIKTKLPPIDREIMFSRWSAYDPAKGARTLDEHYEQVNTAHPKYGYEQKPLYGRNFNYDEIVVDILHMKLRICDQLLKHSIKIACEVTTPGATQNDALQQIQNAFTFFTHFSTTNH